MHRPEISSQKKSGSLKNPAHSDGLPVDQTLYHPPKECVFVDSTAGGPGARIIYNKVQ